MSLKIRHLLTPLALPVIMTALSIVTASFTGQPVQPAAAEGSRVILVSGDDDKTDDSSSRRGYLGVSCQRLRANLREVLEVPEGVRGILISDVVDGSPADKAGLRNRDIVLKMDGKSIEDERDFTSMIRSAGSGTDITLTVWRAGQTLDLHPTLARAPREHRDYSWSWSSDEDDDGDAPRRHRAWSMAPMPPMPPMNIEVPDLSDLSELKGLALAFNAGRGRLGVQLQELTPEIAPFFGAPSDKGVLVWKVMEDSPAEKAGIKAGDVIVEIEGKKVADTEDLHDALSDSDSGDKVAVTLLRRGQSQSLTATLDDGDLRFGNARVLRDRIRTPHGPGWYPGDAPARRSGQDGPGPDGPPMERLERQMNRLQEQMDRLKEKLDKLKN